MVKRERMLTRHEMHALLVGAGVFDEAERSFDEPFDPAHTIDVDELLARFPCAAS